MSMLDFPFSHLEIVLMTTNVKGKSEKAPNSSHEQEQEIIALGSVSFEQANELAKRFGKSPASVRAKVKQLGVTYIPKAKPTKKVSKGDTKAELIAKIETALDARDMLTGLEKATAQSLVNLLGCAKVAMREAREHGSD